MLNAQNFLQWCLPRLRCRWPGFRNVRKQVCKRIARRIGELGLEGPSAYREYLDSEALPQGEFGLKPYGGASGIYQKTIS